MSFSLYDYRRFIDAIIAAERLVFHDVCESREASSEKDFPDASDASRRALREAMMLIIHFFASAMMYRYFYWDASAIFAFCVR